MKLLDPDLCPHPVDQIKTTLSASTGSWSALCPVCGQHWLRTDKGIPAPIMTAVYHAVGLTTLDADQARNLGLYVATVGSPYLPPSPLKEGLRWIMSASTSTADGIPVGGVECGVYHDRITSTIVDAFHAERTEFALTSGDHALMLAARFGRTIGWWDGSWQAAAQHDHFPAGLPEPQPDAHLPVKLILVDSTTGLIAGMRLVTWPYRFHAAVHKAVRTQLDNGSDHAAGMREIADWVERYPSPDVLVERRAEMTCRGGSATAHAR